MFQLDSATIILMSTLMAGAMSVVLYSAHVSFPAEIKGLNYWAAGLVSLACGALLFSLRHSVFNETLVLLSANSALVWGVGLAMVGTRKFYGLAPAWWLFHLVWLLAMLGVGYWLLVQPVFAARVAVFSFLVSVFYINQILVVWRHGERHFSTIFFGSLLLFQTLVVLTRGILALLFGGAQVNLTAVGPFQSIYLAAGQFMVLLLAVGFKAVTTRRLQAILERRSTLDPLTQVLNRRGFADIYAKEHALMRRESTAMTMLSIDLDYFKKINDCYGHATGDRVLVDVAQVIGKALRVSDHVARFGGEEFIVLLPVTGVDWARDIAERILAAVREPGRGDLPAYTVSIGIACQISSDEDLDAILMRADEALYRAKERGRDCIEIAPTPVPPLQAIKA